MLFYPYGKVTISISLLTGLCCLITAHGIETVCMVGDTCELVELVYPSR